MPVVADRASGHPMVPEGGEPAGPARLSKAASGDMVDLSPACVAPPDRRRAASCRDTRDSQLDTARQSRGLTACADKPPQSWSSPIAAACPLPAGGQRWRVTGGQSGCRLAGLLWSSRVESPERATAFGSQPTPASDDARVTLAL